MADETIEPCDKRLVFERSEHSPSASRSTINYKILSAMK